MVKVTVVPPDAISTPRPEKKGASRDVEDDESSTLYSNEIEPR